MIILVNRTPDHIPADVIATEQMKVIDSASLREPGPSLTPVELKA
jgi:hypothetical protein